MPAASPSPAKRPSLAERSSSTHSLSSSSKQTNANKAHRPHVVSRHSRNVSHGKGLGKLSKTHSTAHMAHVSTENHHQRKKSGASTPPDSPRIPLVKRNTSHATLPKNTSQGNLRKNHSASTLGMTRNLSHPVLKKAGLPPAPKPKTQDNKHGVFQMGDQSDEDDEEAEWEDSTTQSPEFTRDNSKTSTPARMVTPNGERMPPTSPEGRMHHHPDLTSSPPAPSLRNNRRSAPDLRQGAGISADPLPAEPSILQNHPRASRAPPAMSTISAHVAPGQMLRSDSTKSFTHISHAEAAAASTTPGPTAVGSSSADGGVSHFLPSETPKTASLTVDDDSDSGAPSNFLSNYKPQPSESPEKSRGLIHKPRLAQASRTQQKAELERTAMLRLSATTPTAPPTPGLGLSVGSSTSLHSRTGSRGRNRSLPGGRTAAAELKAVKQDYENAVKQLTVVRRFRSPILDSVNRLKDAETLPFDIGADAQGSAALKSRPQSRRGLGPQNINGHAKSAISRSYEEQRPSPLTSRPNSRAQTGKVRFNRQSSHDDIEVTPSQVSPDGEDGEQDGLSPEEALIRRIWESREVYDTVEQTAVR